MCDWPLSIVRGFHLSPERRLRRFPSRSGAVGLSPEEAELRLLEDQIEVLRNRLILKGPMDEEMKAEWNERYKELRARPDRWGDAVDAAH